MAVKAVSYIKGDTSGRFPLSFSGLNIIDTDSFDGGFYVLADSELTLYDRDGNERFKLQHEYTSPAVAKSDKRLIFFDRGGTEYSVLNKRGFVLEHKKADGAVIAAAIDDSGAYALSVRSDAATSTLCVFDKSDTKVFEWNCAYSHVSSIALTDGGKTVAVAAIGAENGNSITELSIFGVEYSEPLYSEKLADICVLKMYYPSSGRLFVLSDSGVFTIRKNSEKTQVLDCFSAELSGFSYAPEGRSALSLVKYGGSDLCELYGFNRKGETVFKAVVNSEPVSVFTDGKFYLLLCGNTIYVYNKKGEGAGEQAVNAGADDVFLSGTYIYCRTGEILERYSLY